MNNRLTDILPAPIRQMLYLLYSLVALLAGAIQVGFSAAGADQPVWLKVALAVIAFLGTVLGLTAASNTRITLVPPGGSPPTPPPPARQQPQRRRTRTARTAR